MPKFIELIENRNKKFIHVQYEILWN